MESNSPSSYQKLACVAFSWDKLSMCSVFMGQGMCSVFMGQLSMCNVFMGQFNFPLSLREGSLACVVFSWDILKLPSSLLEL